MKPFIGLCQQLAITSGLLFAMVASAHARPLPGWQADWQPVTADPPYDSGFSNLELGGYLEFEKACEQAAEAAGMPLTYEYRLSDLVQQIGTGEVKTRCLTGDETVGLNTRTAVPTDIESPYCLQVQTDKGSGLRIRADFSVESQQVGFLPNGTQLFPEVLPIAIITNTAGRQWLSVPNGWASISARAGEHVNFQRCG
ncbi:MAG: hypothetical protein AAF282_22980 [Cyanobacteria bacterium P01_A01_bin.15]